MKATLPPSTICAQARMARDARFDGVFFTAVKTTGIYCRPVCPVPPAKERNVDYYVTAAEAESAGFRPCLRCRPERSPAEGAWRRGDALVARALRLIDTGALDHAPVTELADRLHVGDRHLRRLFVDTVGTTPQQVHATKRLLFAKQLLAETRLPMTDIAFASGFESLRRFNDAFRKAYALSPGELRKEDNPIASGQGLSLTLSYRPPLDFKATLDFLRPRALHGLEHVGDDTYARVLDAALSASAAPAWFEVSKDEKRHCLRLQLHGVAAHAIGRVVERVRKMFDLDADPHIIGLHLQQDKRLSRQVAQHPGLRLPGAWLGDEVAVRAVLGQQVSVQAASTFARRVLQQFGEALAEPVGPGLQLRFPSMETLAQTDLGTIGLTKTRSQTLRTVATALARGDVGFDDALTLEDFEAQWTALPGIGPWTTHYIAMRGLRHPDAFPAGDLVLRKQMGGGTAMSEAQLLKHAESWRPWRAYAALHFWHAAAHAKVLK